jgi:hypothetical protein
MGIFDAFFSPTKNQTAGFGRAIKGQKRTNAITNPFFTGAIGNASNAQNTLADFLGLNGPEAQQGAFANFSQGPAAEANLAEGTRAIDQSAAARGLSQSGQNLKDLQSFGQTQFDNNLQQHLANLGGLTSGGFAGAQGLQGGTNALGQLRIGRGASQDAGNAGALGNILGLAGTLTGSTNRFGGITPFGKIFG